MSNISDVNSAVSDVAFFTQLTSGSSVRTKASQIYQVATNRAAFPPSQEEDAGVELRWLPFLEMRLEAMGKLTAADLDGLPVPPPKTLDQAIRFAYKYFPPTLPTPSVVPSPSGGVELIWFRFRWHLEIDFSDSSVIVWAHDMRGGELWRGSIADGSTVEKLEALLKELSQN